MAAAVSRWSGPRAGKRGGDGESSRRFDGRGGNDGEHFEQARVSGAHGSRNNVEGTYDSKQTNRLDVDSPELRTAINDPDPVHGGRSLLVGGDSQVRLYEPGGGSLHKDRHSGP